MTITILRKADNICEIYETVGSDLIHLADVHKDKVPEWIMDYLDQCGCETPDEIYEYIVKR